MIRSAIIEDVSAIRRSLTAFLNTETGCEVVASCESVEEFLALDASAIEVNVILSDIGLPGMNGIEGIRLFKKLYPDAERLKGQPDNTGYNVLSERIEDMVEAGIIDSTKAIRCALVNAASVTGMFLTSECSIITIH